MYNRLLEDPILNESSTLAVANDWPRVPVPSNGTVGPPVPTVLVELVLKRVQRVIADILLIPPYYSFF
jgi:hypothetical protein